MILYSVSAALRLHDGGFLFETGRQDKEKRYSHSHVFDLSRDIRIYPDDPPVRNGKPDRPSCDAGTGLLSCRDIDGYADECRRHDDRDPGHVCVFMAEITPEI